MYRLLTAASPTWRDVWPGAVAAGIAFSVLQYFGSGIVQAHHRQRRRHVRSVRPGARARHLARLPGHLGPDGCRTQRRARAPSHGSVGATLNRHNPVCVGISETHLSEFPTQTGRDTDAGAGATWRILQGMTVDTGGGSSTTILRSEMSWCCSVGSRRWRQAPSTPPRPVSTPSTANSRSSSSSSPRSSSGSGSGPCVRLEPRRGVGRRGRQRRRDRADGSTRASPASRGSRASRYARRPSSPTRPAPCSPPSPSSPPTRERSSRPNAVSSAAWSSPPPPWACSPCGRCSPPARTSTPTTPRRPTGTPTAPRRSRRRLPHAARPQQPPPPRAHGAAERRPRHCCSHDTGAAHEHTADEAASSDGQVHIIDPAAAAGRRARRPGVAPPVGPDPADRSVGCPRRHDRTATPGHQARARHAGRSPPLRRSRRRHRRGLFVDR